MKQIRKTFLPIFLLSLFTAYQVSITMFTHIHYVDGVMVVHSHPYAGKHHTHAKSTLAVIARLSSFQAQEASIDSFVCVARPLLWFLQPLVVSGQISSVRPGVTSLRAPPAC